jgi:hypothetical protein
VEEKERLMPRMPVLDLIQQINMVIGKLNSHLGQQKQEMDHSPIKQFLGLLY